MPIIHCAKCGMEYDTFYIHSCEGEDVKKKQKEKQVWETASGLRKIFLYHPETPFLVKVVSFVWLIPFAAGLLIGPLALFGLMHDMFQKGAFPDISGKDLAFSFYITVVVGGGGFLSYGLSHLKRWSLYTYVALLIFIALVGNVLLLGLMGLLGFILVLFDYKKFR